MSNYLTMRRCETCGGELIFNEGSRFWQCRFCGNKFYPKDEKGEALVFALNRAAEFRRRSDFDGAIVEYTTILKTYPDDDEANWGMFIARCGIEYVKDDRTGNMIPTCHRTLKGDVLGDKFYQKAISNASEQQSEIYQKQAKAIERLQKRIKQQMDDEEEYEVFISFKSKDENGYPTRDSVVARNIHDKLTSMGIKTFFSEVTLADRIGDEYEPIIYKALHSCKYFILVTTSEAHTNAVWVKNEWARFRDRMDEERMSKCAFAVFDDSECIPSFMRGMQGFDLSKYPNGGYEIAVADFLALKLGKTKRSEPMPQYTAPTQPMSQSAQKKNSRPILVTAVIVILLAAFGVGSFVIMNQDEQKLPEPESDGLGIGADGSTGNTTEPFSKDEEPEEALPGTQNLSFKLINNGAAYELTGIGLAVESDIVVPATYNDLPVVSIGARSFQNCTDILNMIIQNGVTSIGEGAFNICKSLTSITIPKSVVYIGDNVFQSCYELKSINFKGTRAQWEAIEKGNDWEPYDSGYTVYCTDGNIVKGDAGALLPENRLAYTKINNGTEYKVTGIGTVTNTVLTIPSTVDGIPVTAIADKAFSGCTELVSVTVGSNITSIGEGVFMFCDNLTALQVEKENTVYHSAGNCIMETESKTLIAGCNGSVIPDDGSVTAIGKQAFARLNKLTEITIPNGVTSIGDLAFGYCSGLISITIPNSVISIGNNVFNECSSLKELLIPESVTSIGGFCYCSSLERIEVSDKNPVYHSSGNCLIETETKTLIAGCGSSVIPDDGSVTAINSAAFQGNNVLKSIVIPDCVTELGNAAFNSCANLESITIGKGITSINSSAFSGCDALSEIKVSKENPAYHSSGNCLIETGSKTLIAGCGNSLIPDDGSVTTIGMFSFNGRALTELNIPDGVMLIEESAFSGCKSLKSVTIPDSAVSIGDRAFSYCESLESIKIGKGVKSIGTDVFIVCGKISVIEVSSENTAYRSSGNCLIEISTKKLIQGSNNAVIPDDGSITTIGENAFWSCKALTGIVIPDGVTTIAKHAFVNCNALKNVTIPTSVTVIGESAFSFTGLQTIIFEGTKEEWNAITKRSEWDGNSGSYTVYCSDGNISK